MPPIAVAHIRTKSRHFHRLSGAFRLMARLWFLHHHNNAKLCTYRQAVRECLLHTLGSSIRSHVVIGGFAMKQNVADTPAHEIGLIALGPQRPADVLREYPSAHAAIMSESRLGWKIWDWGFGGVGGG